MVNPDLAFESQFLLLVSIPSTFYWLIFTGYSHSRTTHLYFYFILFYCIHADVSLNSPSQGPINVITFLSPCKNVYMYAHLGNTLLITRLLSMDSELSLLLSLSLFLKEHIYIIISLSSTMNIKVQNFTGFKLAIEVVRGPESEGRL